MYHYNFSGVPCYVNIFLEIDGLKSKMGNWSLCASYEGKINRLEKFQDLGIGRIIGLLLLLLSIENVKWIGICVYFYSMANV